MRILVICKRQYTGKDLLDDRYGRLFELPLQLAECGHNVSVLASSYRPRGALSRVDRGVHWRSVDAWPWPFNLWRVQAAESMSWKPDVIWASSDALHLVAGERLGKKIGVPVVLDLYDDYEAFNLTRLPGIRRALRQACAQAQALSVVSETLANLLPQRGPVPATVEVIGNGVPKNFAPSINKEKARLKLGLPATAHLVGTAGTLNESRGIADLLDAVTSLQERDSKLYLVIAGPRDRFLSRALPDKTIDLGTLPHSHIPLLFRALDVGVVCNRDSSFGRACHPQKLVEMAACGLPLVAAAVGDAARLLGARPQCLYTSGNAFELANRIAAQLLQPQLPDSTIGADWSSLGRQLANLLEKTLSAPR